MRRRGRSYSEVPERRCEYCGAPLVHHGKEMPIQFSRRRFCNRQCQGHAQRVSDAVAADRTLSTHARRLLLPFCERCGTSLGLEIHHVNGNRRQNESANVRTLCHPCHMRVHFEMSGRAPVCSVEGCGESVQGWGFCNKHYLRAKRYGDPLYVRPKSVCHICGQSSIAKHLCTRHYQQVQKHGSVLS